MDITIDKCRRVRGTIDVPGDKSIAHRALILGAICRGVQSVGGVPSSQDVGSTISCLRTLGARIEKDRDGSLSVSQGEWSDGERIYAGNSGTTARLVSGLVAGKGLQCMIDGDGSLRTRPMERIAEPLRGMGSDVRTANGGCLPMRIAGGRLAGIEYRPPVASAQVKSAVLIAGLHAKGETTVIEEILTRDHTENLLSEMGVPVRRRTAADGDSAPRGAACVTVPGGAEPKGIRIDVPGDISSAAFFIAAAAAMPGSEVRLRRTGVNRTRTGALDAMRRMGADIALENEATRRGEAVADVVVRSSELRGIVVEGDAVTRLIDELPVLAVIATQAQGTTMVRGARELRHKESDRIHAIVSNLSLLGANVDELEDGFVVEGPCALQGGPVDAYGDHRIAMAMAVAGLLAEGSTRITGSSVVAVSYPGFFEDLRGLVE